MNNKLVKVVAGIILRELQVGHWQVLIAKRQSSQHQGGLWEFPGGKIENNELSIEALKRELKEEVNLDIEGGTLFQEVVHDYSDKRVSIQFFTIKHFSGNAKGLEGQAIQWIGIDRLNDWSFPAANQSTVKLVISQFAAN